MSNDLPYILCCDWNFSPRVNIWRATGLYCRCHERRREMAPSLAALWLGTKIQRFCGTNQKPEPARPFGTGPLKLCPQGRPFLVFSPPPLTAPGSPRMYFSLRYHLTVFVRNPKVCPGTCATSWGKSHTMKFVICGAWQLRRMTNLLGEPSF